jgi:hypothetical protein
MTILLYKYKKNMIMVANIIYYIIIYAYNYWKNANKSLYVFILIFKTKLYVGYFLHWYIRYHKCRYKIIVNWNFYYYNENQV